MKISKNPSSIRSKKEITDAMIKLMQQHPFSDITVKQKEAVHSAIEAVKNGN